MTCFFTPFSVRTYILGITIKVLKLFKIMVGRGDSEKKGKGKRKGEEKREG